MMRSVIDKRDERNRYLRDSSCNCSRNLHIVLHIAYWTHTFVPSFFTSYVSTILSINRCDEIFTVVSCGISICCYSKYKYYRLILLLIFLISVHREWCLVRCRYTLSCIFFYDFFALLSHSRFSHCVLCKKYVSFHRSHCLKTVQHTSYIMLYTHTRRFYLCGRYLNALPIIYENSLE